MEIMYVIYIPLILFLFIYLTFKMINFMPKRIEIIRNQEIAEEEKAKEEEKPVELHEKLEPKIELWVAEKKFCRPELTIKKVAEEIGTNYNYLSAHLNRNLGMNFQSWLNTLRVNEGKSLLLSEPRLSIEEIGTMVGFTQNYNFSKWFKLVTGMTPFQYRKQNLLR
jgi:YesN/AraC family two-component response regulator